MEATNSFLDIYVFALVYAERHTLAKSKAFTLSSVIPFSASIDFSFLKGLSHEMDLALNDMYSMVSSRPK
jgi:hypothetical protein